MAIRLKQSTASQEVPLGYFVDSTDGNTEETGLTIANTDIKLWKMGATTLANKNSGGGTHISNGVYYAVLDATDTNTLGALVIFVHVSGALPVRVECEVLPANIYDSWIAGTDLLDVSTTQFNGSAVTAASGRPEVNLSHIAGSAVSTTTAQLGVNVVQISGDSVAADNLESYCDGTTPQPVNVTQVSGDAAAADNLEAAADGTGYNLGGGAVVAASVTGAVGSVTGAVGSVTGSVGSVTGAVGSVTGAVGSVTGNVGGNVTGSVGSIAAGGITASSLAADAITAAKVAADVHAEAADAVWDEALSGHAGAGSAGEALSAAGTAGDPWTTALPGAYGAGTAGKIIGDNLNATVSSRATQTSVDTIDDFVDTEVAAILAAVDTEVAAIKAKTDNLPASPAAVGDIPTAATVADAVWDEARSGHTTAGSFGQGVASVQGNVTGSVASVTGAVGSVTGAVASVTGNVGGSVASVASGGITAASFASDAITAAKLAADVTTELQSGLATASALSTLDGKADAIKAKTDSLTFTVAGSVDANIQHVNDTQVQGTGAVGTDEWRAV